MDNFLYEYIVHFFSICKKKKRKLEYTDEELFEATGGARFGMRAQTQQRGKWNRAEDAITKDEEESAKAKTEWDGMAAPKVLLSSTKESKSSKTRSRRLSRRRNSTSCITREFRPLDLSLI